MSKTEPEASEAGTTWATPLVAVLDAVRSGPHAAMLVIGLLLIVAAFIHQIGSFKISTGGSQTTMLVFGAALCLFALIAPAVGASRRQRVLAPYRLPAEANDLDFMFRVFYAAMPPAFVKRVDNYDDAAGKFDSYDILYSKAFDMIQGAEELREARPDDQVDSIRQDHHAGDLRALRNGGRSTMQVEFPPYYRLPILTMKTYFEHKGNAYIAGWYIPIDAENLKPGCDKVSVRHEVRFPKMRLLLASRDRDGIEVPVAPSLWSTQPPVPG